MNQETVILRDLTIGYVGNHRAPHVVALGLQAAIRCGELTCLLGENGVGKSTLLRTLAAFQPPLSGEVLIAGRPQQQYADRELARTVGVVLTERPDVQQMTAGEMVAMGRQPYTGFWGTMTQHDRDVCAEAISLVGIDALASRQVATLSDGERQKVMIAKALAQQTPVILLDEPTAFLDYPSKVDMLLLLRRISREAGKTVFLSTHDLELALQTADTLWLMERGGHLTIGTATELASQGALTRFVERSPGVHFNAETLTIDITKQ